MPSTPAPKFGFRGPLRELLPFAARVLLAQLACTTGTHPGAAAAPKAAALLTK